MKLGFALLAVSLAALVPASGGARPRGSLRHRAGCRARAAAVPGRLPSVRPACASLDEGTSVGYTDRYPGFFHGQQLHVTSLAAGRYWLVHRANQNFGLRERSYGDDAASLLIRISWPDGRRAEPRISKLRAVGRSAARRPLRCAARAR